MSEKNVNRIKLFYSDGFPFMREKQVFKLLIEKMLVVEKEKHKQPKFNVMASRVIKNKKNTPWRNEKN